MCVCVSACVLILPDLLVYMLVSCVLRGCVRSVFSGCVRSVLSRCVRSAISEGEETTEG